MGIIEAIIIATIIGTCAIGGINILRNYIAREEAVDTKLDYWENIIANR